MRHILILKRATLVTSFSTKSIRKMQGVLALGVFFLLFLLIVQSPARNLVPTVAQNSCILLQIKEELQLREERTKLCCIARKLFDKRESCKICEESISMEPVIQYAMAQCNVGCTSISSCCTIDPKTNKCQKIFPKSGRKY